MEESKVVVLVPLLVLLPWWFAIIEEKVVGHSIANHEGLLVCSAISLWYSIIPDSIEYNRENVEQGIRIIRKKGYTDVFHRNNEMELFGFITISYV